MVVVVINRNINKIGSCYVIGIYCFVIIFGSVICKGSVIYYCIIWRMFVVVIIIGNIDCFVIVIIVICWCICLVVIKNNII